MVSNSTIVGAAGEHYVMCQLLRREMIAALAPAGYLTVTLLSPTAEAIASVQFR